MNSNLPKIKALIFYGSLFATVFLAFTHQTKIIGQASLFLLTVVIFTKPASKLFPTINLFKVLLALRRELGQATAVFVIGHVFSQILKVGDLPLLLKLALTGGPGDFRFWGFWGFVLILPLFITSNNLSTRLLGRNWSRLHKLIHPLYIFAMIHSGLREGSFGLIKSAIILIVLYAFRLLAARGVKFFAPPPPKPVI